MDEMKALQDVFNLRPEMFMAGMRSLDGVRQADALKLQQQELANQTATLQNQYAQENNPIKTEQARFGLMKDRAMFPGDLAQSRGQVRKEQESGLLTQEQVPQALTFAASMASNPAMHTPALHGVMRGIMKNAYVPEIMDKWTPQQFQQFLPQMLDSYAKLLPKNAAASNLQEDKLATQERIAADKARVVREAAVAKAQAAGSKARDFMKSFDKVKKATEKINMLNAEMARLEPEDPLLQTYSAMRDSLVPMAQEEIARAANPSGFEQDPATKEWRVRSPVQLGTSPATADRPARQAATERVTIYKDGKAVGTVPKAQAEQATKEGYTLK